LNFTALYSSLYKIPLSLLNFFSDVRIDDTDCKLILLNVLG